MPEPSSLGAEFARAFVAKDHARVLELLDPAVDFRALTPNRNWEASSAERVVNGILDEWLEASDEVEELEHVETDMVADRERVGYRFRVRNPEGRFVVEQQAYVASEGGRINWMRVVCSGFRPDERA
ncbi:MAG: hypothetical protein QOJ01_723 [Solirubrobacterales bacterium]|jgi:hypothetical protein|nr:hypothetical protein [Solirubrobacterales bacterium]